jgi:pimeloyl-ACP methyl ester carboxylesterase
VAWEREQWDRCDPAALVRLSEATRFVDVEDRLAAVAVPTLILAPACSALTPLADQLHMRTTIPDAEIEVFEGRGHTVYQDEPRRCTERIRRFIAARRAAAG